jgi:putative membrane protein
MNHAKHTLILTATSLLLLAACRDQNQTDNTSQNTTTGATPSSQMTATTPMPNQPAMDNTDKSGMGTTNNMGANPMAAGASTMNDAQILQITHFANVGEVAQARLAMDKAKDPRVKQLAQMMLNDHGDADKKGLDLAKKENLTLADSPMSTSLKSDADSTTDTLKSKTGSDFDKAYVDSQVTEHQSVLDSLDQKLIPGAKDSDVKGYLTDARAKIAMHLDHAKQLQSDLAKGNAGNMGNTGNTGPSTPTLMPKGGSNMGTGTGTGGMGNQQNK